MPTIFRNNNSNSFTMWFIRKLTGHYSWVIFQYVDSLFLLQESDSLTLYIERIRIRLLVFSVLLIFWEFLSLFYCCSPVYSRDGVLKDVLGLEDVLEDTFWSPRPWPFPRRSSHWPGPRSLKSSKIGLSSDRVQHFFLNLSLASDFFVSLASSLVSSTPPLVYS